MHEKAKQGSGAGSGKVRRLRGWFRALLAVVEDYMAVTLGGLGVAGSGLAVARAAKAQARRL